MATYIKDLVEDNGDITRPVTEAGAVLLSGGGDLETTLASKADQTDVNGKIDIGDVQSTDIVANAVITAKIADGAVTADKIEDYAVTTDKISDEAVTGDKIDWESLNGSDTITSGGATWTWMYLPNGKKMYCTVFNFSIPSGTTSASAWRNSSNSLTLPDSLTFSTAVVSATMFYAGNGEVRTTPLTSGTNTIRCGANNLYTSGAFTVNGHIVVIAK